MSDELTLVIIKPDGVARGLVGEVLGRLENAELKIRHLRLVEATRDQVLRHYGDDPQWLDNAGTRAVRTMEDAGVDWRTLTGVEAAREVGGLIRSRLVDYLCEGPVIVVVAEGPCAIRKVRQIVGATLPLEADADSIRGRFCSDDVLSSFLEKRALRNVVHASGASDEALAEIEIWT